MLGDGIDLPGSQKVGNGVRLDMSECVDQPGSVLLVSIRVLIALELPAAITRVRGMSRGVAHAVGPFGKKTTLLYRMAVATACSALRHSRVGGRASAGRRSGPRAIRGTVLRTTVATPTVRWRSIATGSGGWGGGIAAGSSNVGDMNRPSQRCRGLANQTVVIRKRQRQLRKDVFWRKG